MNNMNSLENHLRQWKPRSPSPKIENEIFSGSAAQKIQRREHSLSELLRWFVPVFGCFVLIISGLNSQQSNKQLMFASTNMILGNWGSNEPVAQTTGLIRHVSGNFEHNNIPSTRVEWAIAAPQVERATPAGGAETNYLSR